MYCTLEAPGWGAGATILRTATLPWSIQLQSNALLVWCRSAHTCLIDLPSTTPCELWLDACILHQWTIFVSSQASNLLSFVAKKPHCL